jgi:hypothetical protein
VGLSLASCSSALLPSTAASGLAALADYQPVPHVATVPPVSLTVPPAPVVVTGLRLLSLLNSTCVASRVATEINSACLHMNTAHGLHEDAATTSSPLASSMSTPAPVSSPPVIDSSRALDTDNVCVVPLPSKVFTLQHPSPSAKECGYTGPVVEHVHEWLALIENNHSTSYVLFTCQVYLSYLSLCSYIVIPGFLNISKGMSQWVRCAHHS